MDYGNGKSGNSNDKSYVMPSTEADKSPSKVNKAVSEVKSSQHKGDGKHNPGPGSRSGY